MDHISIILVDYNSADLTKLCLASLKKIKTKDFSFSVIVVDNASQKPLKLAKSLQKKNIHVIRSESNLGFSGGNNLGVVYAAEHYDPDFICLLNNDTTVAPDFLIKLHQRLKKEETGGIISPKIYFAKGYEYHQKNNAYQKSDLGNVLWYAGGSIDWPNLLAFHRGVDEVDRGQLSQVQATDFCTGCCVLISREVMETVGLLDEKLFLYYEDVDLSLRTAKKGYQVLYEPSAKIWHYSGGSTGGAGSELHLYYQTRNRIFIGLKYGNWRVKLTSLSYLLRTLINASFVEKKAAWHALLGLSLIHI